MRQSVLLALLMVSLGGCRGRDAQTPYETKSLSREETLAVGREAALALELPADTIRVVYDEGNHEWNEYLGWLLGGDDADLRREGEDLRRLLGDKEYQSVHTDGGRDMVDSSFWVLVDKQTGEQILAVQDVSVIGMSLPR